MDNHTENKVERHRSRLALVLGSGSVRCAASLGLWEVLNREGIPVDMVVGCSGGSIFGAAIACGMDRDLVQEAVLKIWDKKIFKIDFRSLPKILFPRFLRFDASFRLYKDAAIVDALETFFGDLSIEDTSIPLYIVATDFTTGKRVALSKGKIADAIRASISYPLLLRPKEINGQLLIDGGISDPLPIDVAIKEGADIIVAMGYESPYSENLNSPVPLILQLTSVSINNLLTSNLAFHSLAHHDEIVLIVPKFKERIGDFDTEKIPYIIDTGRIAIEEQVSYIKTLLSGSYNSM